MSGLAQRSDDPWLAALPAAVLYGAWAAYANQDGGLAGMGVAALLQGAASLLATRFGLYLLQCLGRRHGLAQRQAPLLVVLLLTAPMAALHWLSGTPHPLASVAPSFVIGWLYFALWARRRRSPASQRRLAGAPLEPFPVGGIGPYTRAFLSAQGRAIAMLEILGKASSINVRKVLWTCAELNLPYRREDWGSGFRDTHAEEFLALNPNAMVPVLRDGELVLWESNSIIRYLASAMPANASIRSRRRCARGSTSGWTGRPPTSTARGLCLHEPGPAVAGAPRRGPGGGFAARLDGLHGNPRGTTATHRRLCRRRDLQPGRHRHRPVGQPLVRDAVRASVAASGARLLRAPRRPSSFLAHGRNGVP